MYTGSLQVTKIPMMNLILKHVKYSNIFILVSVWCTLNVSFQGKVEFVEGFGTPLGEIARVDASISRFKNDDLKILHKILFKTVGKSTMVKKNIKKFNGFDFKRDSDEYNRKIANVLKMELKQLKSVCEMLDLLKSGSKDEIVSRVVDFLVEPKDSGKPLDGGRPRRSAAVKANNRGMLELF